jgi:hypothetical protein
MNRFVGSVLLCLLVAIACGSEPCQSGLQSGQRTGPYAALISTGTNRGTSHCYICESADRPTVIVFARSLSDPLARLVAGLDKASEDCKPSELRPWVTFLSADQTAFDPQVVAWARKHAIRNVPLGVFEDRDGPPSYRLSRDADVTILLNVKQKVVTNFSFRTGELTDEKIAEVLKAISQIAPDKK